MPQGVPLMGDAVQSTADLLGRIAALEAEIRELRGTLAAPERGRAPSGNALLDFEKRFRGVLDTIPDYLFSAMIEDGTLLRKVITSGVEKITGYTVGEHEADPWLWLKSTHPEDAPSVERALAKLLAGTPAWLEYRIVRKDGAVRWVRDSAIPIVDARGKVVRIDGITSDVTARKETEESNLRLQAQLHQARKMQAIGTLAGGIAHDFNNMLGAIIGYTSLLKSQMPESHPFHAGVDTIEKSAERAAELTRQLLGFARGGKYRAEPVFLGDIVRRVHSLVRSTFDRTIAVEVSLPDDLPPTEGDASQLEHLLLSLCLNARDAMPRGGRLHIETSRTIIDEAVLPAHPWVRAGDFITLTVTDNGVGMTPETKERIFEPFFTTKEAGGNSGMGLPMVYGVVKNHGGFIEVQSRPGEGASFRLSFPVSWRAKRAAAPEDEGEVRGGNETILVVDDEPALRDLAAAILSKAGYRVVTAASGEDACEAIRGEEGGIALALMDIEMPGIGGKQTFLTLRGTLPDLPIIVSTGHGIEGTASEILQLGGTGFLAKPYRNEELLRAVRRVLDSK